MTISKSVQIQIQRFRSSLIFWIKYLAPFFLVVLLLMLGWYIFSSTQKLFAFIEFIFSTLKTDQQKSDILLIWKYIFQANIKIFIFDFLAIIGAAFIGWMFYQGFLVVSEYLYIKINKKEKIYQLLREKYLLDLYKKATPWFLIFNCLILLIVSLILIPKIKYIDVFGLLDFFWITMLIVIPSVYILVWYLYYKILFKKMRNDEFKYFFYSKAAVSRRLQGFLNAFISLFVIMQLFFLSFSLIESFEKQEIDYIKSHKIYKRFWESDNNIQTDYTKLINVISQDELYNELAKGSDYYNNKEMTKVVLTTIYNILVLAFAFEVLFPYLTIFLMFKLKRKETKKLLLNITIPIGITMVYQLITEGIYFGIHLENVLNYKTFSVYIFTLLIMLIKQDNLFKIDTNSFENNDKIE